VGGSRRHFRLTTPTDSGRIPGVMRRAVLALYKDTMVGNPQPPQGGMPVPVTDRPR